MLSKIISDSSYVKESLGYRVMSGKGSKEENDKYFELYVQTPKQAYAFARDVPGADIEKCQEIIVRMPWFGHSWFAYLFARNIEGADIRKCEEATCYGYESPYWFALNIPGANIKKCRQAVSKNLYWAKKFDRDVKPDWAFKC